MNTKKNLKNNQKIKRRKNFLPTLLLALLFWAVLGWFVYATTPNSTILILVFFGLQFTAIFLTMALLFANSRRGLLIAIAIIGFLIFRYYELASYLNLALFLSILVCLEFYFKD